MPMLDLDDEVINLRTKAVFFGLQGSPKLATHYRRYADNLTVTRDAIETSKISLVRKS